MSDSGRPATAFHSRARRAKHFVMSAPANRLVIALAQIPAIVGDTAGNRDRLRKARAEAAAFGADIVMAPELFLSGYPPEDLVLKPAFQEACRAACEELARETARRWPGDPRRACHGARTAASTTRMALLDGGRIEAVRFKVDLPNYGVFDEKRVFSPGPVARADCVSRRARRRADLRGYLGTGAGRVHRRDGRRDAAGRQRVALRARQDRRFARASPSRGSSKAGCRSSI